MIFITDEGVFDSDKMTVHYLLLPTKQVSCGCKDKMVKHSSDLSDVDCPICMEIEMVESGVHRDEMRKEG